MIPVRLNYSDGDSGGSRRVFMAAVPRIGERVTLWQLHGGPRHYTCAGVEHYLDLEDGTSTVRVTLVAAARKIEARADLDYADDVGEACRWRTRTDSTWCVLKAGHSARGVGHLFDPAYADTLERAALADHYAH